MMQWSRIRRAGVSFLPPGLRPLRLLTRHAPVAWKATFRAVSDAGAAPTARSSADGAPVFRHDLDAFCIPVPVRWMSRRRQRRDPDLQSAEASPALGAQGAIAERWHGRSAVNTAVRRILRPLLAVRRPSGPYPARASTKKPTRPAFRRLTASLFRAHIRVVAAPAGGALRIDAVGTAESIMAAALDTHAAIERLTAAGLNTTQAEALPTTVSRSNPWAARETETENTRLRARAIHQGMAGSSRGAARLTRSHRQDPATRCPPGGTHGSPSRTAGGNCRATWCRS